MHRVMRILLGIEIALGILFSLVAAMAHGAGGLGAVYVFFIVYAIFALIFLFAAFVCWKYPEQRRIAAWMIVLPVVFWFVPRLIRVMAGEYLSIGQLTSLLAGAACVLLAACWFVPKKITRMIPDGLLRSRLFNWLVLLAVIGGWLFFVAVVIYVATDKTASASGGEALGMAFVLAALYLLWMGVGSFLSATWAWLCLRSGIPDRRRRLNIAQLVIAAPGVLLGVAVAMELVKQELT